MQVALANVQAHPEHWLLPLHRQTLYRIFDPIKSVPLHQQVRPWLELITARYVLPLWEPIRDDPQRIWKDHLHEPLHMISMLEEILNGTADMASVPKQAYHYSEVSGLTGELPFSQFYHAWCVYNASLRGLLYAIGNDEFSDWQFSITTTEIDHVHSDTANWAAIAFAGGIWQPDLPLQNNNELRRMEGSWDRDSDVVRNRRKQFWEWWLLEAIPHAHELAQTSA